MLKPTIRTHLYTAVRGLHHYPWQVTVGSLLLAGIASLFALGGFVRPTVVLAAVAAAAFLAAHAWWVITHVAAPGTAAGWVNRRSEWAQRTHGLAGRLDVMEHASVAALRQKAHRLRPSLRHVHPWRIAWHQLGVLLGVLGLGFAPWHKVHASCEQTTFRVGGPRSGKTASLIVYGLTAPGALITTSTRLDIAEGVHAARKYKRVHVYNPKKLGGVPNTVVWSVLQGCEDYEVAERRAAVLIPPSTNSEHEHWAARAREMLAIFMNAAALDGRDMTQVAAWIADEGDNAADSLACGEIVAILRDEELGGQQRAQAVLAHWNTNARTRTSVTHTMKQGVAWLSDPMARAIGDAPLGVDLLDIEQLIRNGETLHLLGPEGRGAGVDALTACIVNEIEYTARQLAGGHRLDPFLTMLLDEVALTCPIPLPRWLADSGGFGIVIHGSVQSVQQLADRWGESGKDIILATSNVLLVFGSSNSIDDYKGISALTGEHMRKVIGADSEGDHRTDLRWTPVMSEAEMRALPEANALILRPAMLPVIARTPTTYHLGVKDEWLPGDPRWIAEQARPRRGLSSLFRRPKSAAEPIDQPAEQESAMTLAVHNGRAATDERDETREEA